MARCICCDGTEWKNVDEYRYKPSGMAMCTNCGMISYPKIVSDEAGLKDFYREEYRDVPTINNVFTGQRKLQYHNEFLRGLFAEWKKAGKEAPVVTEIGSAFGLFVHWMRANFPRGDIGGTELTLSYRRVAFHEYGIFLAEDLDEQKAHDMIVSYKVAEHMPNFDRELERYARALKDDGRLYISVPTWFGPLTNFGVGGFSLEYYYHKNHVNVWTQDHFERILWKAGFAIESENHTFYDNTYLCRKVPMARDLLDQVPMPCPNKIEDKLKAVFVAAKAYDEAKFDDAIAAYPNFPDAHVGRYESNRAGWHKLGFEGIKEQVLDPAIKACPDSAQLRLFIADVAMRYDQFKLAMSSIDQSLGMRPNHPAALTMLSQAYRQVADRTEDPVEKAKAFMEAREVLKFLKVVSAQSRDDATNWMFHDHARIPMPQEKTEVAPQPGASGPTAGQNIRHLDVPAKNSEQVLESPQSSVGGEV